MKSDDLLNSINKAVVVTELYDAVAAALKDAGIDNPARPWGQIADQIEADDPGLAYALRCAQDRWYAMFGKR